MNENGRNPVLSIKGLKKYFPIHKGFLKRVVGYVKAVDDVTFDIYEGETLGLVGESGCGKSTLGRCILRAINPTSGRIMFYRGNGDAIDMAKAGKETVRLLRRDMQLVFQDPYSSLNPRMTVKDLVGEPLVVNGICRGREVDERVGELIRQVGLRPEYMDRYPHAFSGGQRQRIAIARSIALNPRFVVCDEPVSALDVSIQAQIINLLMDLQGEFDLTYLFVAHDLSVVRHITNRVAVMYVGQVVELADTAELFGNPLHPYTEALFESVPKTDPDLRSRKRGLSGEVPDPSSPPSGCYFHPRCRYATELCRTETPQLREIAPGRRVRCHHAEKLDLKGMEIAEDATIPELTRRNPASTGADGS